MVAFGTRPNNTTQWFLHKNLNPQDKWSTDAQVLIAYGRYDFDS
jgi:hypothetical protein